MAQYIYIYAYIYIYVHLNVYNKGYCPSRIPGCPADIERDLFSPCIFHFFGVGKDQESLMPCLLTRSVVQESNLHSSHLALEWMDKCRPFKAVRCISSWFSNFCFLSGAKV